ncbi:MAG TPA: DUF3800 domain-containing protein [Candidatus Acidoferrales bacterium]|nr:DUF3800 domain-containing protein [Candidatus Acidoferrales bacterium]
MVRGFSSYCDEFGHPDDPNKNFMGICGLLGWSDDWITLSRKWRDIQKSECIPNPFHMTDFVHHKEKFSDYRWHSLDERKRVLKLLLDVINPANLIPVSASVSLRDFNSLRDEHRSQLKNPYDVAFQEVTFNLAAAAANRALQTAQEREEFFGNRIAMVYAKLKKFTGPAEKLWDAIKEFNPGVGNWMSSYTPGEPADYPPLQVADIWAYTLGHLQEKQQSGKEEARIAFKTFVHATFLNQGLGHNYFTFFDRREILSRLGQLPEME